MCYIEPLILSRTIADQTIILTPKSRMHTIFAIIGYLKLSTHTHPPPQILTAAKLRLKVEAEREKKVKNKNWVRCTFRGILRRWRGEKSRLGSHEAELSGSRYTMGFSCIGVVSLRVH